MLRTKHLNPDGKPRFTNRLALESSPYLLQHAHNPVNWYPWGNEAFETAERLDRPILLSIGYSTCHWCHVMEEESFEDIEIAAYLNAHYIAVKVDREERPDIDSIYMKAVMALQGSGGWPMTVFLSWDKKPFYGGTYFPARDGDRGAFTGFLTLLNRLDDAYRKDPQAIKQTGRHITALMEKTSGMTGGDTLPTVELISRSVDAYKKGFDWKNGGMTGRNKFPSSLPLDVLIQQYPSSGDDQLLEMISLTLDRMMAGGIQDHVAGGFHRYATDRCWHIPHYEKMLYDNALISIVYTRAYQLTGKESYRQTSQKTLNYLLKEMQSPEGGLYSATDADSLNSSGVWEEGYFFTWTTKEIEALFDDRTSKIVNCYYGLSDKKNQRQTLYISEHPELITKQFALRADELETIIANADQTLYQERLNRSRPGLDDKILLSWNSLAISAFAKAGAAFNREEYIRTAIQIHAFIFKNLWYDQKLFHSFKNNNRGHQGFLEDYAFFTAACIDLYEATSDAQWLTGASDMDDLIQIKFEDVAHGGFYMAPVGQADLIIREKPADDGAIPSGNAVAVNNLVRLYQYTHKEAYRQRAEKALKYFSNRLMNSPEYLSGMLPSIALLARLSKK